MSLPGTMEILVIMLVALLIFGPKRMPQIGRSIARTIRELTRIRQEIIRQITSLDDDSDDYTRKEDPL
jgi:TatA/E family protein of Tat protein translocase